MSPCNILGRATVLISQAPRLICLRFPKLFSVHSRLQLLSYFFAWPHRDQLNLDFFRFIPIFWRYLSNHASATSAILITFILRVNISPLRASSTAFTINLIVFGMMMLGRTISSRVRVTGPPFAICPRNKGKQSRESSLRCQILHLRISFPGSSACC